MTYLQTLGKRYDQLLQTEWDYWLEFFDYKKELYSYRYSSYNLFHWGGLFMGVVAFYFNYSVVRFAVYFLSFVFRLLMLPLRVAIERFINPPLLRRSLLFFCSIFETVGGITRARLWFLTLLEQRHDRWEARKAAFLQKGADEDNNPIVRAVERLARFDERWRSLERRTINGLVYRLYRYYLRYRLPFLLRFGLNRVQIFFRLLWLRRRAFYKGEAADDRLEHRWETLTSGLLRTQWVTRASKMSLYLRWGGRLLTLARRFVAELFSSTPLLGRRPRKPSENRSQRYRISRYFPRKYAAGRFVKDEERPKN